LTELVGYQQPSCLRAKMEFVVGTISLLCNCTHIRAAVFVHVGAAKLCTENGVSCSICSAVEVARLAQNIRRSSTRV